jgi:hypothetical protein
VSEPPRVETQETWQPIPGLTRACQCGHLHHGRRSSTRPRLAPQWNWCDAYPGCACRILTVAKGPADA